MTRARTATWLLAGMICGCPLAAAHAADDFYKGKTISIITSDTGGGMDAYARLVAQHIVDFIAGHPSAVVQAIPGASGLIAANHLALSAARDGTVLGLPLTTAFFTPIFSDPGAKFKTNDFTWIGSLDQATDTCSYWKGLGVTSFDDVLHKQVTFAADGPSGIGSQYPRTIDALLGGHAKVVHGYRGTGSILLALQRGEAQASCTFMLSALTSAFRNYYDSGQLVPFIQFGRKSESLKGVPYIVDFAKSNQDKQVFKLIYTRDTVSRAIVAPPKIPVERRKILRAAFDAMVKDPKFLADAAKRGLPIDPMSGAQDDAFVEDLMDTPAPAVKRADEALAYGLGAIVKRSKSPDK